MYCSVGRDHQTHTPTHTETCADKLKPVWVLACYHDNAYNRRGMRWSDCNLTPDVAAKSWDVGGPSNHGRISYDLYWD